MTRTTGPELNKGCAVAALTPPARQAHLAVLAAFAETGRPPARAELERIARAGGADPAARAWARANPAITGEVLRQARALRRGVAEFGAFMRTATAPASPDRR
jgi:hypothetical protein